MQILLTETLEKDLSKIFSWDNAKIIFLNRLKEINPELIYLKRPYVKIKVSLFSISFRIIWKFQIINWILVLIFVLKKVDKTFWENIIWNKKLESKIDIRLSKINQDIENWNYKLY